MELPKEDRDCEKARRLMAILYALGRGVIMVVLGYTAFVGLAELELWREIVDGMQYPKYVMHFVGEANLVLILAMRVRGYPRLEEWTYAAIVVELLVAGYSHVTVGDAFTLTLFPFAFLIVVVSTYLLRPEFRDRWLRIEVPPGKYDMVDWTGNWPEEWQNH